jgi:hypothetical protein
MTDDDDIECAVLQMVARFGADAAEIARGLARSAAERQRPSAQTWRRIANAIERGRAENFTDEIQTRRPCDAMTQLLAMRAELKRNLIAYETSCRAGDVQCPEVAESHIRAIKHQITEYERAITALIPQTRHAH